MPEEKQKKQEQRYEVVEIATQTTPVIRDTHTAENFDIHIALCKVMNYLEELKEQLM